MVLFSLFGPRRLSTPLHYSWHALAQLRVGQPVQVVVERNRNCLKGTFLSVTDEEIRLCSGTEELSLEREEILSVGMREAWKTFRSGLAGAGLGASAAWALGQLVRVGMGHGLPRTLVLPFIVAAAGVGALGALDYGYRTVFRAKQ